ncbi:hypothetical protein LH47_00932 [Anoxybacillus thermarum]|uniref:Abortive phage infection protein n=1 Tax=Anoxybacillus thermarum TaxID=404937 RepID=A0A0D0RTS3_9BACL|nr:hypothetical protein [Anoxybacillus sp. ST4]KIQ94967.1 hypothetical protein LH47_00932 [Anoxybacillus thermarum]MBW7651014.1 hypothetical protein [Anoxybacillus sp. ST4]
MNVTEQEAKQLLQQLRTRDIPHVLVKKEHFLTFRHVLVQQEDFKHFRGVAQRGGDVVYYYMDEPRS